MGAPGETSGFYPKPKESDFSARNEVVSALDWTASFVREQSRKASDATFASALESVAAKVADMSQGVKNAFQELVLTRAGNGGAIRSE